MKAQPKNSSSHKGNNGGIHTRPDTDVTVEDILHGTTHTLTIFKPENIASLSIFLKHGKPYLTCYASDKDRPAKPEEIVRQLYVKMLMDDYGYPAERIAIEKPVQMGSNVHDKPADIVIWDKDDPTAAYIIIECKKPKRSDGAFFAKNCVTPATDVVPTDVVPRGVVIAFDRDDLDQDTCPKGWRPFELSRGRVIVGAGDPSGSPGSFGSDENGALLTRRSLREYGGTEKHSLVLNEMPSHTHEYQFSSGYDSPHHVDNTPAEFGKKDRIAKTSATGDGVPHNNMPPYVALYFCKKE